jgi:hypothetical protein
MRKNYSASSNNDDVECECECDRFRPCIIIKITDIKMREKLEVFIQSEIYPNYNDRNNWEFLNH